nr:ribonuclease H-like domain-containing protein [Tanacetum cinerariifolium]
MWREFDALTKLPNCTCEARNEVVDHDKLMKLMQFLMGLDDVYQPSRNSILTREVLLEAKDAFVIISREESHRGWIIDSGANQHMINDTKNMVNLIDVSSLNLTVGHPNRTIAKITHVGNLKHNNDVILFDGLVFLEYTVSLLSMNKLIKDSKLSVCFDESNCYIQDLRKGKILGTGSEFVGLYLFDEKFNVSPTVCNSEYFSSYVSKDIWHNRLPSTYLLFFLVYGREPNLSHLRSFGCLCYVVVVKGSDKFSSKSENWICKCREGSLHQPVFDNNNKSGSDEIAYHLGNDVVIYQLGHGEPQTATPIDEIIQSEGNVGSSNEEASKDVNWINSMNDEMQALYENDTWELVELLFGKKAIGRKWVYRIKYMSSGEIERHVVTPLPENIVISHKETANDKPDISYVVNCLSQHMHSPLQSHFDLGLRLLRYLKLDLGSGINFAKSHSKFSVIAYSDSDWAKCLVTRRPVTGYCVFVNGSLVFWKSKRQATLYKCSHQDLGFLGFQMYLGMRNMMFISGSVHLSREKEDEECAVAENKKENRNILRNSFYDLDEGEWDAHAAEDCQR